MATIQRRAPASGRTLAQTVGAALAAVVDAVGIVLTWQRRANDRHRLLQVDDRMLRDMGLTSGDVYKEARKPFWMP